MKVALIQQAFQGSKAMTMQRSAKMIKKAAQNNAQLIVLQELHTTEYFCQSENTDFFDYALSFQEDCEYFSQIAKNNKAVLVTSLFEPRTSGLYHNTAVVFEKNGEIAGKYRKMHIPDDPGFYEKFYFTQGDLGFTPITTSLGKLGILICWDQWYPEAARIMALKGAEILIYPTAIGWFDEDTKEEKERQREAWIAIQRGHSIANAIPVIATNRVGFEEDKSGTLKGIRFWGSSFAFGAQGELLTLGSVTKEEILYFQWNKSQTETIRRIWPFLRDRRIDSYQSLLKCFDD
ncbi:MAG: carbon-nitrogen hydrolase [Helicobacter apodemus]|nr:carbon-nitrogen hydrolase [Helicobacter apodemus]